MARVVFAALLILLPAAAQKISLRYGTVPREDVERRLKSFRDSNAKREQQLKQLFEEVGCNGDQLTEQPVQHAKTPNLICAAAGEGERIIVVGAHYDLVERGQGVLDNWSGASLLPSLFLSVRAVPRKHTFIFVSFTDEEKGLVGSKFYVHELGKEGLAKISAMVNIDSIGAGPTKVELDRADTKLANALGGAAAFSKLPLNVVNVHRVGRSDSDSFQDKKIPSINIHSLTQETWPILHTWRDQMNAIQFDDYYNTYLLIRVYLAELDQVLDAPQTP